MNHVYRLVWSKTHKMLIAVAEIAGSRSKGSAARSPRQLRALIAILLMLVAPMTAARPPDTQAGPISVVSHQAPIQIRPALVSAQTFQPAAPSASPPLPTGGEVVAGQATLNQNGDTLTIAQSTDKAVLNWQSFDIGAGYTVNFLQPDANSVALNRVLGSDPSKIFGHLNANGQVLLTNANGVYFAPGAEVHVAGLVASTLGINNADFLGGNYHFSGASTTGVSNDGSITAARGGYVAFIGPRVENQGSIVTPGGVTALGAGSAVDLTLAGNQLVSFAVSGAALDALAANGGLIQTDGGRVLLSAQAKDALLQTVVNNSGQIRAQTVENHHGVIELLGGDSGAVQVAGTLDASAPDGGDGGFIETSGTHLNVVDGATITSKAASGKDGTWLIDPFDFTIAASGGDITGAALSTALGSGNVTIQTTDINASCSGAICGPGSSGDGDIHVNDTVSWSANTLTLNAYRNININTAMNGSDTAGLALQYGQGAASGVIGGTAATYHVNAPINLAGGGSFSTQLGSSGAIVNYTILTSLGAQGSISGTDLQGINGNRSDNYVLGANIDASATSTWDGGQGFQSVGNYATRFHGTLDGLGHTISGLHINRSGNFYVGLIAYADGATLRNIGLLGSTVTGGSYVGALVGINSNSTIHNAHASGSVSGSNLVGGLVGNNFNGTISNAYASGSVSGSGAGGLVGNNSNNGTIRNSYATGTVSGNGSIGGLVGSNRNSSSISDSHASGSVSGTGYSAGGLVGYNTNSAVSNAYASGEVSGNNHVGGLVGILSSYGAGNSSTISHAYATGKVTGNSGVGGLAGSLSSGDASSNAISSAYATGDVSGNSKVGGLAGSLAADPFAFIAGNNAINNAHATGSVRGGTEVGGLVGSSTSSGTISGSYASGGVNGNSRVGGLVGDHANGTIVDTYASGGVSANGSNIGGLVGRNLYGTISDSYATGNVGGSGSQSGGLVGFTSNGKIHDAYATGSVGGTQYVGGLVGLNGLGTINDVYATGNVSGTTAVGGLVGRNTYATINNAYAIGNVNGNSYVGGVVGSNYIDGVINASYWNTTTSGQSVAAGRIVAGTSNGVAGLTTAELAQALPAGFSAGVWGNGDNQTTPYLLSHASFGTVSGSVILGSDASATPTAFGVILTLDQLQNINNTGLDGSYVLGNNIDASATSSWEGGAGFVPLGDSNAMFTGTFDGLGYSVNNLTINRPGTDYVGLFGFVQGSALRDIGVVNADLRGADYVGGLVGGSTNSTISDAYATGSVSGASMVGGLVGGSAGSTLADSYATANVNGLAMVGGLVGGSDTTAISAAHASGNVTATGGLGNAGGLVGGAINSTVSDAYASGSVSGIHAVGGLVGGNNQSVISGAYASGNVSGDQMVGGLVGASDDGTISNVYASGAVSGNDKIGGLVGSNRTGTINDAHATGSVSGNDSVGGLVGYAFYGTVSNAHATSSVNARNQAGGLVGFNYAGTINNAYASGSVSGATSVGGLVGQNSLGSIGNVYATGSINGVTYVGGLIGQNYEGTISDAYATGNVSSMTGNQVGGLAGFNNGGLISNAYATGDVYGNNDVGGLVGWNLNSGASINNTYATGSVIGSGNVGGLVGFNIIASVTDGYWNTTTTGQSLGIGQNISGVITGGDGLTTAELVAALPTGFNTSVWGNGDNQTTPYLLANASFGTVSGSVILGSDSSATPTAFGVILTLEQLQNINNTGLAGNYVLGGDIDANATSGWNGGAGFAPLGDTTTGFSGIFDGLGYTISDLVISRPGTDHVGLFGVSEGTLRNVGLLSGSVSGGSNVGGLVGYLDAGTIRNVYATGSISGVGNVGGLVGITISGTIHDSYVTNSVSGNKNIGGLVGYNYTGTISDTYATGSVSGNTNVGGLVGYTQLGTIAEAYATGSVLGNNGVGALVGTQNSGTLNHGYWDIDTTGMGTNQGVGILAGGTITGGGLTSVQMQQQASFGGFDFTNGWVMYEGHTAPLLRSFMTALTITSSNRTEAYTGSTFGLSGAVYSVAGADTSGHLYGLSDAYGGARNAGTTTYAPDVWSDQHGYIITLTGGALTIDPRAVTLAAPNISKDYDGTTAYTVTPADLTTLSSYLVGGDTVTGATMAYADTEAGIGNKSVLLSGVNISDGNGGNNYLLSLAGNATSTINPLTLNLTLTGTRTYDGTAAIAGSLLSVSGLLAGDSANVSGSGMLASKHVGNQTISSFGSLALDNANYALAGANSSVTITPLAVTLAAPDITKTYDGTTTGYTLAAADLTDLSSELLGGDTVTGATITYADKHAGNGNKTVLLSNVGINDGNGGNNYLVSLTGNATSTINPLALVLSGTRHYDGSDDIAGNVLSVTNLIGGDSVSVAGSGTLVSKHVGSQAITSFDGLTVDNSDYTLAGANGNVTIDPLALTLTAPSVSKTYDGTTDYSVTSADLIALSRQLMGADSVTDASMDYTDKHAGDGNKTVLLSGVGIDDGNGGNNYAVILAGNTTSTIDPKALTVTGLSGTDKTYDGSTLDPLVGTAVLHGLVGSETLTVGNDTIGTLASAQVGPQAVTTALTIGDGVGDHAGLASNYVLTQPTLVQVMVYPNGTGSGAGIAGKLVQGGYFVPVSGPDIWLDPQAAHDLVAGSSKPTGVDLDSCVGGLNARTSACRSVPGIDPYTLAAGSDNPAPQADED